MNISTPIEKFLKTFYWFGQNATDFWAKILLNTDF